MTILLPLRTLSSLSHCITYAFICCPTEPSPLRFALNENWLKGDKKKKDQFLLEVLSETEDGRALVQGRF